jgi:hypothetical protein
MTYDSLGSNAYKHVRYGFNADNRPSDLSINLREKLQTPIIKPKLEAASEQKKEIPEKSVDAVTMPISEKVTIPPSEMLDISFKKIGGSRNLVLYENKKPAISKEYHFNYDNKTFAGIVTDKKGQIYLYDRSSDFYRPLKHLGRQGDPYSGYHAGFKEERNNDIIRGNYINLGTLEILQAALQSTVGGKYAVKINHNDSFMTNWMDATSPSDNQKFRYWNGNVTQLNTSNLIGKIILKVATTPFGASAMQKRRKKRKNTRLLEENSNLKIPHEKYTDTLIDNS